MFRNTSHTFDVGSMSTLYTPNDSTTNDYYNARTISPSVYPPQTLYGDHTSSVTTAGCKGKGSTQRKGKRQIPPNSKSTNQHVPANSSLTHSELRIQLYEKEGPFTGASSINRSRSRGNRERREWADIRDGKEETLSGRYVGERKMARESLTYFGLITVKRMRPLTHISLERGGFIFLFFF